jgi:hypothetical protein
LGILKDKSVENKSTHTARTKKQHPQQYFSNFRRRTAESKRLLHVYSVHYVKRATFSANAAALVTFVRL